MIVLKNMDDRDDLLIKLFIEILDNCDKRLFLSAKKDNSVYISAPKIIISFLKRALIETYKRYIDEDEIMEVLCGCKIKIIPSHDMAITIFHSDFPYYNEKWMCERVLLLDPKEENKGIYREIIVNLETFIRTV